MKKQQNIEITPAVSDWYGKNFKSPRAGISDAVGAFMDGLDGHPVAGMFADPITAHHYMLTAWRHMWRHTLSGLKGRFTVGELSLLIDIHNGHMPTAQTYGTSCLYGQAVDAMALDGVAEKWDVDRDSLLQKLAALAPVEATALELWATGFWYGKDQAKGLEDYVAVLVEL